MKIEWIDRKNLKVIIEKDEDLFVIYKIINKGDIISSYDYRVIKYENEKEKKKVWIKIEVEDIRFSQYSDSLRISGKILESDEEVVGHYHTLDIRKGSEIIITKEFKDYEKKILEDAIKERENILIVSIDNNEIAVGIIGNKLEILYEKEINVSKEDPERDSKIKKIYSEVLDIILKYYIKNIVICGPIFYPEEFYKYIEDKIKDRKVFLFKVSQGGTNGIYEFTRRKEYLDTLKNIEILEINSIIEDFIYNLSKGNVFLGIESAKENIYSGNAEYILISEEYFRKMKEEGKADEILNIMDVAERQRIKIYFVFKDNNYFDLINKYGIVGKLRFKY